MRYSFRKQATPQVKQPPAAPSLADQFKQAKDRFDAITTEIDTSSLSQEYKQEAHNLNESEYRKSIEALICSSTPTSSPSGQQA